MRDQILDERGNIVDDDLPTSLLDCIRDHMKCMVPRQKSCNANFQICALNALEESKKKRLEGSTTSSTTTTTTTITSTTTTTTTTTTTREKIEPRVPNIGYLPPYEPPEIDKPLGRSEESPDDIEDLKDTLSNNFTLCIAAYTTCMDTLDTNHKFCKKAFDDCSLAILIDSRLDENDVGDTKLDEEALDADDDKKLATELYECIRDYMMCQMGTSKQFCMRDYQICSLAAMDKARERKRVRNGSLGIAFKPGVVAPEVEVISGRNNPGDDEEDDESAEPECKF